jgi:Na+-transporting NADH:ubiquinone oxidoreductase subunit C
VSASVVVLKPRQDINKDLDFKKNILEAAGLLSKEGPNDIAALFQNVQPVMVDLSTGQPNPALSTLTQAQADKDPQYVEELGATDPAGIKRRSKVQTVYLVRDSAGRLDQVVVRVYGRGLWSTMYGFLALDRDGETVRGFSYYQHGETPGLGGEVDNPRWKAQWKGKKVLDANFAPAIRVVKGQAAAGDPYQVDGLAGATLTAKGVQGTFDFWLSERGYGPLLAQVKKGAIR